MKSTIQKSLYILFLANFLCNTSCFARKTKSPKKENLATFSSLEREKKNPIKYFLSALPPIAVCFFFMLSKKYNGSSNNTKKKNLGIESDENTSNNSDVSNRSQRQYRDVSNTSQKQCNQEEQDVFLRACVNGNTKKVEKLLKNKHIKKNFNNFETQQKYETALHLACKNLQEEIVKILLNNGATIKKSPMVGTPLHSLCKKPFSGQEQKTAGRIMKLLLKKYPKSINIKNVFSENALHLACKNLQEELVKILLNNGATIVRNYEGNNPLHDLCKTELGTEKNTAPWRIIKLLLEKYPESINKENNRLKTPLYFAIIYNSRIAIKTFIQCFNDLDMKLPSSLQGYKFAPPSQNSISSQKNDGNASSNNSKNKEKNDQQNQSLNDDKNQNEKNDNVSNNNASATTAQENGFSNWTKRIVDSQLNDKNGNDLLIKYTNQGKKDYVKYLLLKKSVKINNYTNPKETPLYIACKYLNSKMVEVLLENGADVNLTYDNDDPIFHMLYKRAVKNPYLHDRFDSIVQSLVKYNANINALDKNRKTALFYACKNGHFNIAKTLLENNAAANLTYDNDDTILHAMCKEISTYSLFLNSFENIVTLLIKHGININAQNDKGRTALFWACEDFNTKIIDILVEKGADATIKDNQKYTPLQYICTKGFLRNHLISDVIKSLKKGGAYINAQRQPGGDTALHFACQNFLPRIIRALIKEGAYVIGNNKGYYPIHSLMASKEALSKKNDYLVLEIIDLLKSKKKEIVNYKSRKDGTALDIAKKNGVTDPKILQALQGKK